jgi:hypothetical protein
MKTWPGILFLAVAASCIGTVSRAEDPKASEDADGGVYRCRGFVAGVEATFLRPTLAGGNMLFENEDGGVSTHELSRSFLQGAPRIWLGVENDCGWGIRGRYWDFHEDAHGDATALFPLATLTSGNSDVTLRTYTADIELTKRMCVDDDTDVLASFGVRHALRDADETLAVTYRPDFTTSFASLWDRSEGTGLTSVLEGSRRIGSSGFSLYGNVRGSVLWGGHSSGYWNYLHTPLADAAQGVQFDELTTQYVFETQFGIRWAHQLDCLKANVFSHLVFEYQRWTTSDAADFRLSQSINNTSMTGNSLSDQLEFAGLSWAIGFTR